MGSAVISTQLSYAQHGSIQNSEEQAKAEHIRLHAADASPHEHVAASAMPDDDSGGLIQRLDPVGDPGNALEHYLLTHATESAEELTGLPASLAKDIVSKHAA